jgi:hypothetical protein
MLTGGESGLTERSFFNPNSNGRERIQNTDQKESKVTRRNKHFSREFLNKKEEPSLVFGGVLCI